MKIIKNDKIIKVIENDFEEEYSFDKEINFEKLIAYLLSKNLSSKIILENESQDNSDNEQSLINIIEQIINNYNERVDEYKTFLAELDT